jgi:glyoxylase-like metal-dependent hydrolase (beta-lactamase superfamily II)
VRPVTTGAGIHAIDADYDRPRVAAVHLVCDGGHAAFIDTGTALAAPQLLAALEAVDLAPEAVDHVFLTHVHLDHAGGAGRLAQLLPQASFVVHPRGLAHLADPSQLIAATKAVHGEARFAQLYGSIEPVPRGRLVPATDGLVLELGRRRFEFLHTPGHALHHVAIFERETRQLFSGDTFGVSYREFDTADGEFIFPTTSPTQFDPVQLHASVNRLLELRPQDIYLTHYSRVRDVERLGADLHREIDVYVALTRAAAGAGDRLGELRARLFEHLSGRLDAHGCVLGARDRHALLDVDVELNAAGLDTWLTRRSR